MPQFREFFKTKVGRSDRGCCGTPKTAEEAKVETKEASAPAAPRKPQATKIAAVVVAKHANAAMGYAPADVSRKSTVGPSGADDFGPATPPTQITGTN